MLDALPAPLCLHGEDDLVAFDGADVRTARQLQADVAKLRDALPIPSPSAHTLMVFEHDRYAFAVALLAAWSQGFSVALPPNGRPKTISELLERPEIGLVLHDTAAGGHIHVPRALAAVSAAPAPTPLSIPEHAATVFTSGSTGESTAWPKTRQQLFAEVAVLARTFAPQPGFRFVVTVPPAHLYGLLFGVLLPLSTGGAFGRSTPLLPEPVAECVAKDRADVLVSVPIHLRAIQAVDAGRLGGLQRVFSSTAPLDAAVADGFAAAHGLGITEIFGSTETGGIAWRRRDQGERWLPLPGVTTTIDDDGRLCVDSPFLPVDAARPWVTADLAEPAEDGSFHHRGRIDGVVKVGGRRVSLPHMQQWLASQPGIEDAAVTSVPAPGRGARILAAVVAPQRTEADLRAAMLEAFPSSSVPRRILVVDRLPREANGKLQQSAALALFGLRADGSAPTTTLDLDHHRSEIDAGGETWRVDVHIPEDYLFFEGHFDTYPILPGVVQLHELLLPLVARARPHFGPLADLLQLKFLGRIRPGDDLTLTLRFPEARSDCEFEIAAGSRRCSAGVLRFASGEAAR